MLDIQSKYFVFFWEEGSSTIRSAGTGQTPSVLFPQLSDGVVAGGRVLVRCEWDRPWEGAQRGAGRGVFVPVGGGKGVHWGDLG